MAQQLGRYDDEDDDVTLSSSKGVDVDFNNNGDEGASERGGGGGKAARLPRWTRQEILVLIQGKRVAENRVRRGRSAAVAVAVCEGQQQQQQVEPKWTTVSSYCKRHGVNRGPVQCRKRWSNLAGDFKKIKEWDSHIQDDSDSFWLMRNDVRRERKLPGFFDREVFDILNSNQSADHPPDPDPDPEPEPEPEPIVFDSGRSAAPDDALFSDFEQHNQQQRQTRTSPDPDPQVELHVMSAPPLVPSIPAPTPISEKQYQPTSSEATGTNQGKQQAEFQPEIGSTSGEGRKRRKVLVAEEEGDGDGEGQDELIQVLERNGRILSSQLDAYNINLKLDREERKDHATSLVAVLNKLADALGRIADKL